MKITGTITLDRDQWWRFWLETPKSRYRIHFLERYRIERQYPDDQEVYFEDLVGLPAEGEVLPYLLPNSADQLVKPGTLTILGQTLKSRSGCIHPGLTSQESSTPHSV